MLVDLLQSHALVHASSFIPIVTLPWRDLFKVRSALFVGVILNLAHILSLSPIPDWQDLLWPIIGLLVNSLVLGRLILDRLPLALTPDERRLLAAMAPLKPGELRSFVEMASWRTAKLPTLLTKQNVVPDSLYYVLSGSLVVTKQDRTFPITARTFIGELSFLQRTPASATVVAEPGTTYLEWSVEKLSKRVGRRHSLEQALRSVITRDMAAKLAKA